MKLFYLMFAFVVSSAGAFSQGDSLVIKLKSGGVEKIAISNIQSAKFENITSVEQKNELSSNSINFPNPFSDATTIVFDLEFPENVDILIYDNEGILVRNIKCENCSSGKNQINWDTKNNLGKPVPTGVYYYEIRTKNHTFSKQIIKVK
jgi:hypothetical protein